MSIEPNANTFNAILKAIKPDTPPRLIRHARRIAQHYGPEYEDRLAKRMEEVVGEAMARASKNKPKASQPAVQSSQRIQELVARRRRVAGKMWEAIRLKMPRGVQLTTREVAETIGTHRNIGEWLFFLADEGKLKVTRARGPRNAHSNLWERLE